MDKHQPKLLLAGVVCAALVAGCGGGGGGGGGIAAPDIGQSVSALLDFINNLSAVSDDTSEPIDINALTLAVDDTAEPAAF